MPPFFGAQKDKLGLRERHADEVAYTFRGGQKDLHVLLGEEWYLTLKRKVKSTWITY